MISLVNLQLTVDFKIMSYTLRGNVTPLASNKSRAGYTTGQASTGERPSIDHLKNIRAGRPL